MGQLPFPTFTPLLPLPQLPFPTFTPLPHLPQLPLPTFTPLPHLPQLLLPMFTPSLLPQLLHLHLSKLLPTQLLLKWHTPVTLELMLDTLMPTVPMPAPMPHTLMPLLPHPPPLLRNKSKT